MATLINIVSIGRSGSTMLDLMLGNDPKGFSTGEVDAWFRPWRSHHFQIDCSCNQKPCPVWTRLKNVKEQNFHATIARKFDVDFIIDSSKDLCWIADNQRWGKKANLKIANLLLWKDPIDLAYSYWKRSGNVNLWRHAFINYYTKFLSLQIPYQAVHYNQLTANPSKVLYEICQKLNMRYFENKENFWQHEHHYLFGSAGTRHQILSRKSAIRTSESYTEDFMLFSSKIEMQIRNDVTVQRLIEQFEINDICQQKDECYLPERTNMMRWKLYPFWYYEQRLKRSLRRYYPRTDEIV